MFAQIPPFYLTNLKSSLLNHSTFPFNVPLSHPHMFHKTLPQRTDSHFPHTDAKYPPLSQSTKICNSLLPLFRNYLCHRRRCQRQTVPQQKWRNIPQMRQQHTSNTKMTKKCNRFCIFLFQSVMQILPHISIFRKNFIKILYDRIIMTQYHRTVPLLKSLTIPGPYIPNVLSSKTALHLTQSSEGIFLLPYSFSYPGMPLQSLPTGSHLPLPGIP